MADRTAHRLTRVVVDDNTRLDVAQIQSVLCRIQAALEEVPRGEREYIANALLSLAVKSFGRAEDYTLM